VLVALALVVDCSGLYPMGVIANGLLEVLLLDGVSWVDGSLVEGEPI